MPLDYKKSGVDIDAGNRFVELIKPFAKQTATKGVVSGIGGFGGLFELSWLNMKDPVLVAGADGVGTKLKVAFQTKKFDTVGIDLVAMNVNDILTVGAKPLFFLDYLAVGKLQPEDAADIVKGIADGCKQAECALLGGETAELPGFYQEDEFELAGFAVGAVDKERIIDGSTCKVGDVVIGLYSSGLHSNGYSLARKVFFDKAELSVDSLCPFDSSKTVGEFLLEPTRIYVKDVLALSEQIDIKAMAHITGGGLMENPPRSIPETLGIRFDKSAWNIPDGFLWMAETGKIEWNEMFRVFNCGIGFILIVNQADADSALQILEKYGTNAAIIGEVVKAEYSNKRVYGLNDAD